MQMTIHSFMEICKISLGITKTKHKKYPPYKVPLCKTSLLLVCMGRKHKWNRTQGFCAWQPQVNEFVCFFGNHTSMNSFFLKSENML